MKKFLVAALSVMMLFTLVACGGDDDPPAPGEKTWTVTFDGNGGTPAKTEVKGVKDGEAVPTAKIPTVTKTGFVFDKWTTTKDGDTEFVTTSVITANRTVFAKWIDEASITTEITITAAGNAESVKMGETLKFTATITPSSKTGTITWSISETNKKAGTTIDQTGLLTCAADETLARITVRATATIDGEEVVGALSVEVVDAQGQGAQLVGIEIKTKPTKQTYWSDEPLDLTGLVLEAEYLRGETSTKQNVDINDQDLTFSPESFAALEESDPAVTITLSFLGQTATFTVAVNVKSYLAGDYDEAINAVYEREGEKAFSMADLTTVVGSPVALSGTKTTFVNGGVNILDKQQDYQSIDLTISGFDTTNYQYKLVVYAVVVGNEIKNEGGNVVASDDFDLGGPNNPWPLLQGKTMRAKGDILRFEVIIPIDFRPAQSAVRIGAGHRTDTRVTLIEVEKLAAWPVVRHDVTFDLDFGAGVPAPIVVGRSVIQGQTVGTLDTPERESKKFVKWYVSTDTEKTAVTGTYVVAGPVTLKAEWRDLEGEETSPARLAPFVVPLEFQQGDDGDITFKVLDPDSTYDGISAKIGDTSGVDFTKYNRVSVKIIAYSNEEGTTVVAPSDGIWKATVFNPWKGDSDDEGYGSDDFPGYSPNDNGATGRFTVLAANGEDLAVGAAGWVTKVNNITTGVPQGLRVEREPAGGSVKALEIVGLVYWDRWYPGPIVTP